MRFPLFFTLFAFFPPVAQAEFVWFSGFEQFDLRVGTDYLTTANNFTTDGDKASIRYNGELLKINEFKFYLEPEYGFAPDWSIKAKVGFITNNAVSDSGRTSGSILSGSGIGDISVAAKYRFRPSKPSLIFEALTTVPTYTRNATIDDLLVGDGSVDLTLFLHGGYYLKRFFFMASPYFMMRTGGYTPRMGINLGAGVKFSRVFFMPFFEGFFSLGNGLLFDSSETLHDTLGAGRSYLRLSGSPSGMNVGAKFGVNAGKATFAELYFKTSTYGVRYAAFTQFGANVLLQFHLEHPDTRIQTKEIPFHKNPEDFVDPDTEAAPQAQ